MLRFAQLVLPMVLLLAPLQGWSAAAGVSGPRKVEVCFVLDTTGSMSGLLDAAKKKIWFIASEIAGAASRPEVRFCLLAFRDRGDAYVTQHHDLTGDLDHIYAELLALKADGGGDQPEAVNQALAEALDRTAWSPEADVLKLMFLVGDAPPHRDYDEPQYPQITARAAARGILINPVLCGSDGGARQAFSQIAALGGGLSAELAQPGRVQRTETPMDSDLAVLGQRLDRTAIPYGSDTAADDGRAAPRRSEGLDHATAADRAAFNAMRSRLFDGSGDLIDAINAGRIAIADIDPAKLPPALRSMREDELLQHLETVREEREGLRRVIASLLTQRRVVLAEGAASSADAGFDRLVSDIVRRQMQATAPATPGN